MIQTNYQVATEYTSELCRRVAEMFINGLTSSAEKLEAFYEATEHRFQCLAARQRAAFKLLDETDERAAYDAAKLEFEQAIIEAKRAEYYVLNA